MRLFKRIHLFCLQVREFRHMRTYMEPFPEIGKTCTRCKNGTVKVQKEKWITGFGERYKTQDCYCTNCGPRDHRAVEKYWTHMSHESWCGEKCDNLPKRIKELKNVL